MKILKKRAFTLVELIIVIVILTLLSTIAFISFSNYVSSARDVNRSMILSSVEKSITLFEVQTSKPPLP